MPRSRSLVASPDPASFLFLSSSRICRLMPHRASEPFSCAISGTIEPVCLPTVPSRAPSNLSVYQLCHLVHHRTCLSTNCAISCTTEPVCLPIMPRRALSNLFVLHIIVPISSSPFRSNSSLPILLHHHRLHSSLPIALIVLVPTNIAYVTSI